MDLLLNFRPFHFFQHIYILSISTRPLKFRADPQFQGFWCLCRQFISFQHALTFYWLNSASTHICGSDSFRVSVCSRYLWEKECVCISTKIHQDMWFHPHLSKAYCSWKYKWNKVNSCYSLLYRKTPVTALRLKQCPTQEKHQNWSTRCVPCLALSVLPFFSYSSCSSFFSWVSFGLL